MTAGPTRARTSTRPLLRPRDAALPLAWRDGRPIDAATFVAQARLLAERLPPRGRAVNLCRDRLHFALGLAAALLRGHTSLLPPDALPATLRSLAADDALGAVYALVDAGDPAAADVAIAPAIAVAFDVAAAATTPGAADVPAIPGDVEAVRLLTSGSTGAPTPHAKSFATLHTNLAAEAERLAHHLGRADLHGVTIVATVPAQHSYGLESTVLLALLGGAAFDAGRPFYPADVAAALAAVPEPRALVTTPLHLKTLLRAGVALPRTALVLSATATLAPSLAADAEAAFGGVLVEIYGCTEAGQVASRRTTDGDVWTTLGALRLDPAADAGADRVVVSGGHVAEPTLLADRIERVDATRFRLLGRADDLIHVAGKRSSLAHLNAVLQAIPGVDDGAFWMPPDAASGDVVRPIAFVVAPDRGAAGIVGALRQRLDAAFVPRRVFFVPALPRAATGKLTAAAFDDFARAALARGAASRAGAPAKPVDAWVDVDRDHPAFAGHFPGRPLLPGAALLALVLRALADAPALAAALGPLPGVDHAKFLRPVGPGARLRIALRRDGGGVAFAVDDADRQPVARGRLVAGAPGVPPASAPAL